MKHPAMIHPCPHAGHGGRLLVRALGLAGIAGLCLAGGLVQANPNGPTVVAGNASFGTSGSTLTITNAPGTIINWQGFSIQPNEITSFAQQSAASAVLNRVTGLSGSSLQGQLQSNGRVFLVNPNGIVVGGGARIDTAGFVASTLGIADADFLSGNYDFRGGGGNVINHGSITSGPGGEVILIGGNVENHGTINALGGEIILAAGREVQLTSLNSENISYRVSAPGNRALNLGSLIAQNGAVGVFAGQVNNQGNISANRVSHDARGRIVLHADGGNTVSGSVAARGSGTPGGDITVLGNNIRLASASVDASGSNGGRVRIGGAFQGGSELPAAQRVEVDTPSVVHADATENGNGGRIIVWSEGSTRSFGRLTARGGPQSGNGGLVETSSRGNLAWGQPADVSAAGGAPGTWLLDPEDIVIDGAGAASISSALDGGSNVEVRTAETGTGEGNITVGAPIRKTTGPDAALSLVAHNRVDINAPIESIAGKLSVSIRAGRDIEVNAPIITNGGGYRAAIDTSLLPARLPAEEHPPDQVGNEAGEIDSMEEPTNDSTAQGLNAPPEELTHTADEATDGAATDALLSHGIAQQADVVTSGGDVEVDAGSTGLLQLGARVEAVNQESGASGGNVRLLGEQVGLFDDALVDASGHGGGGEVLIGGGRQGLDPEIDNARALYVAPEATVRSDALVEGDGGTVILYADEVANILGTVSARGGKAGGDGGFVETSGRASLRVEGTPDVSAPAGSGGTWLIDPDEINIVADTTALPPLTSPFTSSGDTSIEVDQIGQALSGGDVFITTGTTNAAGSGNINWLAELDLTAYGSAATPIGSLTLDAANDIVFTNDIESGSSVFGSEFDRLQNLTLTAGGDVVFDAATNEITIDVNENISITASNLELLSGSSQAWVNARERLIVTVNDSILLEGESTGWAQLRGGMNSDIQAANLTIAEYGHLLVQESSSVNISDTLTLDGGQISSDGQVITNNLMFNDGLIQGDASDGSDAFTTSGTVTLDTPATKHVRQTWNIASGSTVNWLDGNIAPREDINNSGTFNAIGNDLITITDNNEGNLIAPGDFNNLAGGTFNRAGSGDESATFRGVDLNNQGTVDAQSGDLRFVEIGYIDFSNNNAPETGGEYIQSGGLTTLTGGTMTGRAGAFTVDPIEQVFVYIESDTLSTFQFNGGALEGGIGDGVTTGGVIDANVDLQVVTVAPGFSPGQLTIGGDLDAGTGATFNMQLDGIAAGQYDTIVVVGDAFLAGPTLNVVPLGYTPPADGLTLDNFDLITAGSLSIDPAVVVIQPGFPIGTVAGSGQVGDVFAVNYTGEGGLPPAPPPTGGGGRDSGATGPGPILFFPQGLDTADPVRPVPVFTPSSPGTRPRPEIDSTPWLVRLFEQIPRAYADDEAPDFLQCY